MHQQIKGHAPFTLDWINLYIIWIKGTCTALALDWINQTSFGHINTVTFTSQYKAQMKKCSCIITWLNCTSGRFFIMDTTVYWLFAWEYSIWNASSCSTTVLDGRSQSSDSQQCHWKGLHRLLLQWFYPAPAICGRRNVIQSLHVTTLNGAFKWKLSLEDYRIQKLRGNV